MALKHIEYAKRRNIRNHLENIQYDKLSDCLQGSWSFQKEIRFVDFLTMEIGRIEGVISYSLRKLREDLHHLEFKQASSNISSIETSIMPDCYLQCFSSAHSLDYCARTAIKLEEYITKNKEAIENLVQRFEEKCPKKLFHFKFEKSKIIEEAPEELENILIMLSSLFWIAKQNIFHYSPVGLAPADYSNGSFERKSLKFWVPLENVYALKVNIAQNLPIHLFDNEGKRQLSYERLSSLYLDNESLDCFHTRRRMEERATLIRVRWYNNEKHLLKKRFSSTVPGTLFIERKTHHESWIINASIKERFPLKTKYIEAYLSGDDKAVNNVPEMHRPLAREIQDEIQKRCLSPIIRTVYNRTSYQLPSNNDVRITVDTDLILVNDSHNLKIRGEWKRNDEAAMLENKDFVHFPFAILEVKLKAPPPKWLTELLDSGLVCEVQKFSKFQQACACLQPSKVKDFPHWFDKEDIESAFDREFRYAEMNPELEHEMESDISSGFHSHFESSCWDPAKTVGFIGNDCMVQWNSLRQRKGTTTKRALNKSSMKSKSMPKPANVRLKVEPKTYFANERTFIQWLTAAILLVTLGSALLSLEHSTAHLTGLIMMPFAGFILFYASITFYVRLYRLQHGTKSGYSDCLGPGLLTILLAAAVAVTTYLHISSHVIGIIKESPTCHLLNIDFPNFFEPSDLAIDPSNPQHVWTCSMGHLIKIDITSEEIIERVSISRERGVKMDLESLTFTDTVGSMYLGTEKPRNQILAFNVTSKRIFTIIELDHIVGTDPVLEGLTFLPGFPFWTYDNNDSLLHNGTFFATNDDGFWGLTIALTKPGSSFQNGTEYDSNENESGLIADPVYRVKTKTKVGAMTVYNDILFAVLDNDRVLKGWNLTSKTLVKHPLPGASKQWEGLAFHSGQDGKLYAYLAKDTPSQIWRFEYDHDKGFVPC